MINIIVAAALGAAALFGVAAATPCPTEDTGTVCHWAADERGNGQGESFLVVGGLVVR